MGNSSELILVIADDQQMARDIKDLLEFMEAESVEITSPAEWREQIDGRPVSAVFVGPDIPRERSARIIGEIGEFDRTIPVVVVDPRSQAAA
jgi:DNA-binding NtrC family response regulator